MSNIHANCKGCGNHRWISGGLCSTCRKRGTLAERAIPSHALDLQLARWVDKAACAGDLLWFEREPAECFPVCAGCPVIDQCDIGARTQRPSEGVWGGRVWVDGKPVTRALTAVAA